MRSARVLLHQMVSFTYPFHSNLGERVEKLTISPPPNTPRSSDPATVLPLGGTGVTSSVLPAPDSPGLVHRPMARSVVSVPSVGPVPVPASWIARTRVPPISGSLSLLWSRSCRKWFSVLCRTGRRGTTRSRRHRSDQFVPRWNGCPSDGEIEGGGCL